MNQGTMISLSDAFLSEIRELLEASISPVLHVRQSAIEKLILYSIIPPFGEVLIVNILQNSSYDDQTKLILILFIKNILLERLDERTEKERNDFQFRLFSLLKYHWNGQVRIQLETILAFLISKEFPFKRDLLDLLQEELKGTHLSLESKLSYLNVVQLFFKQLKDCQTDVITDSLFLLRRPQITGDIFHLVVEIFKANCELLEQILYFGNERNVDVTCLKEVILVSFTIVRRLITYSFILLSEDNRITILMHSIISYLETFGNFKQTHISFQLFYETYCIEVAKLAINSIQEGVTGFENYTSLFLEAFFKILSSKETNQNLSQYSFVQMVDMEDVNNDCVTNQPLLPAFVIKCLTFFQKVLTNFRFYLFRDKLGIIDFFSNNGLKSLFHVLFYQYLPLNLKDLEYWERDPEGFVEEELRESSNVSVRESAIILFCTLISESQLRDDMCTFVLEMIQQTLNEPPSNELSYLLRKDVCYWLLAESFYELNAKFDFLSFFHQHLKVDMQTNSSKIIRRRIAHVLGGWVDAINNDLRPEVYSMVIQLMHEDDYVVRVWGVISMKMLLEDFQFQNQSFFPFLETSINNIAHIVSTSGDSCVNAEVLKIISLIIKVMKTSIEPFTPLILQTLSKLWNLGNFKLVKTKIISVLGDLTNESTNLNLIESTVIPVIEYSTNIQNEEFLFLARNGLKLWFILLQKYLELPHTLLQFFPRIQYSIQEKETFEFGIKILHIYVSKSDPGFLSMHASIVFLMLNKMSEELSNLDKSCSVTFAFVLKKMIPLISNLDQIIGPLEVTAKTILQNQDISTLETLVHFISVFSQLILSNKTLFFRFFSYLNEKYQFPFFHQFINLWITETGHYLFVDWEVERLNALGLCSLISENIPEIWEHLTTVVSFVLDIEKNSNQDSLSAMLDQISLNSQNNKSSMNLKNLLLINIKKECESRRLNFYQVLEGLGQEITNYAKKNQF